MQIKPTGMYTLRRREIGSTLYLIQESDLMQISEETDLIDQRVLYSQQPAHNPPD